MIDAHTELSPTVRRATVADAPDIAALVNLAYRVESFFSDGARTTEREIRESQTRGHYLVIDCIDRIERASRGRERGDRRARHSVGQRRQEPTTDVGLAATIYIEITQRRGYFGLLSVHPDHQGSGLGRRLVAVAEALCEAQGCTSMDLQVVNLRAELPPWYRSLGYEECGTAPFPNTAKVPCHFIRMRKPLAC